MQKIKINDLGEYIPERLNSLTLNKIKEFVNIPYFIDWYKSVESNKVFPLSVQELSDLNPTSSGIPGIITRNPFFDHTQIKFFTAYNNSTPAGRIMAFIDYNYKENNNTDNHENYISYGNNNNPEANIKNSNNGENSSKSNIGWIGLFESIEDKTTAHMLLDSAVNYLRQNKCSKIIGPAKFNAAGEVGLLIKGYENKPYFMEPYNAPYYQEFFDSYGFKKENDWYSISTDELLSKDYMDRISNLNEKFKNNRRNHKFNSYKIRNIDFSNLKHEIKVIRDLYNPIWNEGEHPQQIYMTDKEFELLALGIKEIAIEDLMFVVEKENRPVAVSVNLPDINEVIWEHDATRGHVPGKIFWSLADIRRDLKIYMQIKKRLKNKKFTRMRCLILGIEKEHRKSGIDTLLYSMIKKKALEFGIIHGSGSQMADINMDIINPIFKMGKISMVWRVYSLKT